MFFHGIPYVGRVVGEAASRGGKILFLYGGGVQIRGQGTCVPVYGSTLPL